jgi:glycosyltransferase involved in cell wall biosynthesis
MGMPRILHCIDTTGPGGAETMFVNLAARFSVPPYESVALIRGPGWVKEQLEQRRVPVIEVDSKGSINVGFLRALVREIRRRRIDLVHAHLLGANVYCAMAGRLSGVPVITTFHGSVDIRANERLRAVKLAIVRRWSTTVAVSEALRAEIADRLGTECVRLIENGIDCRQFDRARPMGLRRTHAIPDGAVIIGSLGNVRPAKAYPLGLRALRRVRDSGIDAHWAIAGHARPGDSLMNELESLADALQLTPYVHFLGFVDEPERFLADIDCFLLCSESEGHPLALTQAMAAGKPIVATRCGVERILEQPRRCGWLAPVNAPNELAQALIAMLRDAAERDRRGRSAKAIAHERFDNAAVFAKYAELYGDLLASRSRGPAPGPAC